MIQTIGLDEVYSKGQNKPQIIRLEYYNFYFTKSMHKTAYSLSMPKHNYYAPLSKRFPEDIECIIQSPHRDRGSLYISNIEAAENPNTLQRYFIRAVLSCAKGYQLSHSKHVVPHYEYIAAVDHQNCDIYQHFNQAVDFIEKHLKNTNVLVHCVAGVSRSVSMVIAYLIREHKMGDIQAYSFVKSRRKIINPNEGFRKQLKQYHQQFGSRSAKLISSQRQLKTPEKKTIPAYKLNDKSPLKIQKTASTYQKYQEESFKEKNDKSYEAKIRNLLSDPRYYKYNQEANGINTSAKSHRQVYQDKYAYRYYSPGKANNQKEAQQLIYAKESTNRSYMHNLSQDLDERIKKIKQKYQVHRTKLEERYPKRVFDNYLETKYSSRDNMLQNRFSDRRNGRFKTQSFHQHNQKPKYLNQFEKEYGKTYKNRYQNIDYFLPRSFTDDRAQVPQIFTQKYLEKGAFLNNSQYKQTQAEKLKSNELARQYTYKGIKNSYNRDSFKRFI